MVGGGTPPAASTRSSASRNFCFWVPFDSAPQQANLALAPASSSVATGKLKQFGTCRRGRQETHSSSPMCRREMQHGRHALICVAQAASAPIRLVCHRLPLERHQDPSRPISRALVGWQLLVLGGNSNQHCAPPREYSLLRCRSDSTYMQYTIRTHSCLSTTQRC